MSHRGFRALAVLVISTSFLFASQNFHGTVPGIDSNLAPTHSVDHKNAAAPVHHGADQLAKRVAIPFGHVATNNFNSPPDQKPGDILHKPVLVKRKTWKLEVDVAICKGKKLLQTMADASHNAPRTVNMANLKINGWTVSDVELQHLPAPVVAAMRAYGVDTADTKQRNAMLDHPFPKDGRMQVSRILSPKNGKSKGPAFMLSVSFRRMTTASTTTVTTSREARSSQSRTRARSTVSSKYRTLPLELRWRHWYQTSNDGPTSSLASGLIQREA